MKRLSFIIILLASAAAGRSAEAIVGLMERISPGLSEKIIVEIHDDWQVDSFLIAQEGNRPKISASDQISAAVGLNTYLRRVAGVGLSWNSMTATLPEILPAVKEPISGRCLQPMRYYLNYCTYSYSMAFWDRKRWEQEIDWMALHGINMPLAINGSAALWRNVLQRLGYDREAIDRFVAGPGFQAWWLMNNLEGWGGPNTDHFYERDMKLQQFIVGRMREFGMQPVFAGYSGMLPSDAAEKLGVNVSDPGKWCGFSRPAFLQPEDASFNSIAAIYYDELHRLYGPTRFYSMDPFHEGGNTAGVDLAAAGRSILQALKQANPEGIWVAQGWQENPRAEMVDPLPYSDVVILDLQAENHPMWRERASTYNSHPWLYCMLLNFGGNVGLYGKLDAMIEGYREAAVESPTLSGIGLTMEGIENNPAMYDLICDLPWRDTIPTAEMWIADYVKGRYGSDDPRLKEAWQLLARSVYACPASVVQQGTVESLFCARPGENPLTASAWANSRPDYYDHADVVKAAELMLAAADRHAGNANYRYDLVDVVRQAVADRGRELIGQIDVAAKARDKNDYRRLSTEFLDLILLQDSLLATTAEFRLGRWTEMARNCGATPQESDRMEWNARTQISVWGPREAADNGRLHDYSHREWQGILRDLYHKRWEIWFDARLNNWESDSLPGIDFFSIEREWADEPLKGNGSKRYSAQPEGDPIAISRVAIDRLCHRPSSDK